MIFDYEILMHCPYGCIAAYKEIRGDIAQDARFRALGELWGEPRVLQCQECQRAFVVEVHHLLIESYWQTLGQMTRTICYELNGPWVGDTIQFSTRPLKQG